METLRVYLIGAGAIARHHAAAVRKLPGGPEAVLSVADPAAPTLRSFLEEYPEARGYADASAMLAEPALPSDVVVVATPPATHHALACAALDSGRNVLCEKPFAMDRGQALDMLAHARAGQRLLGCCSSRFLGLPTTARAKALLADGALGRLYHVTFVHRRSRARTGIEYQPGSRWFLDRRQSGGGVIMDWGPYDFAALNDLLQPVRVDVEAAWMANPLTATDPPPEVVFDVEQHAGAGLRYHLADGTSVPVTYERAACTHGEERSVAEVEGERGAIRWDWLMFSGRGEVVHRFDRQGQVAGETYVLEDQGPYTFHDKPLAFFCQRLRGEPSPAIVDEQAVFNLGCLRAVYDCAATGRPQTVTR